MIINELKTYLLTVCIYLLIQGIIEASIFAAQGFSSFNVNF